MRTGLLTGVRSRMLACALACGSLVLPGSGAAQSAGADTTAATSRQELLRQQRDAKRQNPQAPHSPGFLERSLLDFEKAKAPRLVDLNFHGFYPRIGNIERGSRLAYGVRFWRPNFWRGFDVHASTYFSLRGYEHYDVQFGVMPHRRNSLPPRSWRGDDLYELPSAEHESHSPITVYGSMRYRHRPEEVYFGLGPDTKPEDETTYWQYDALYDLVLGWQPNSWLAITTRAGYMTFGGGAGRDDDLPVIGTRFDESTAPGITTQPDYFRVTPQILIDKRDIPGNPHRGFMLGIEAGYYDDRGGDPFEFTDWALDARGYVPLWSQQRVLAVRALYFGSHTPGSNRMPFYMMETLGGSHTLRGYEGLRFRGEDVLNLQAEYRWEASPAVEFALFTDAGTVSEEDQSIELDTLKWDIGWGVRLKAYRFMVFRLDHARSEEMQRFLARLSASY